MLPVIAIAIQKCLHEIATSGLRPPRNDKSEVHAILAMA